MILRNLGLGKTSMDDNIREQVKILGDILEEKFCQKPFDPAGHFTIAAFNSLWSLLNGDQFDLEVQ